MCLVFVGGNGCALFLWGATGVGWVDLFKKACVVDGNEPFRQNGFIFFFQGLG